MRRRPDERSLRATSRREREDAAVRLAEAVPDLASLAIDVREHRPGQSVAEAAYVRRVVVPTAPALFLVPCGDPACRDGEHDLTHELLAELRRGATRVEGEDGCHGTAGAVPCQRVLRWTAVASYR